MRTDRGTAPAPAAVNGAATGTRHQGRPAAGRGGLIFQTILTAVLGAVVLYLGLGVVPALREAADETRRLREAERLHLDLVSRARKTEVSQLSESLRLANELVETLKRARKHEP